MTRTNGELAVDLFPAVPVGRGERVPRFHARIVKPLTTLRTGL
jgi:hypothetical protein